MRHEVLMRHEVVGKGISVVGQQPRVATTWPPDGTAEAAEDLGLPSWVAVQWHPEVGEDPSLFEGLVGAARRVHDARLRGTCRCGTDPDDAAAAADPA
jgi:gamma-glutamyl-gamma-aminobutyrate hydrolase PuuD